MRPVSVFAALLVLPSLTVYPSSAITAPSESETYHIVLPRRAVGAGERVELRLVPPAPPGVRVRWGAASGTGLNDGIYRAPYVIPAGTSPAPVTVAISGAGIRASATTEIELLPGSVPGAEDCLGPGQSFSTAVGDIEPAHAPVDELPRLIHTVDPEYPRSALARGIEDTIPVRALLCRSGRVLDAYVLPTYRVLGDDQPIERDPKLVEAALAAVRQYVFTPGTVSGHPVALWIHIPVAFRR